LNSTTPASTTAQGSATQSHSSPAKSGGVGSGSQSSHHSNTGAIVGGVVGGLAALAIILATLCLFCVWRRNAERERIRRSGFVDGEFAGGKNLRRKPIDLLAGGQTGSSGVSDHGYALTATGPRTGEDGHGHGQGSNLEPVPFVLPNDGSTSGHGNEYDPYGGGSLRGRPMSDGLESAAGASSAAGTSATMGERSKAAMASFDRQNTNFAPNAPARFLVHEDAGSLEGGDGEDDEGEYSEDEVVDLPPQYNSLGVLVPPERRPSRRRSTRRPGEGAGGLSGFPVAGADPARAVPFVPQAPAHTRDDAE
jgi:hypothetical protein